MKRKINKRRTEHQKAIANKSHKRYITKKLEENVYLAQDKKFRNEFNKLTRIMYDDVLPRECAICRTKDDLHIHHKQYVYPIVSKDLVRLCRICHIEEHHRLRPLFPVELLKR